MNFPNVVFGDLEIDGKKYTAHKPIKCWIPLELIEKEALIQLVTMSKLPFLYRQINVMPDVHAGKGSTIGSVIPVKGAIFPAGVGVDVSCGMMAVKTTLTLSDILKINQDKNKIVQQEIFHSITRSVPVGEGRDHKKPIGTDWVYWQDVPHTPFFTKAITDKAKRQLGTLGGGNHFIEICLDEGDHVWVVLHTGSRGAGNEIARQHINLAKEVCSRYFIDLPHPDLAYFPEGTAEFDNYMRDIYWLQEYAAENRRQIMKLVLKDISYAMGFGGSELVRVNEVNCHHNFVEIENHFGQNVMVIRKGAVRARDTDWGIIPGSMGAKSYIVLGKGNKESFDSSSHGAGRAMSRRAARDTFTTKDLEDQTKDIVCRKDEDVVDEIPSAYKDIDQVMKHQEDLVTVVHTLKQIICVKG